MKALIVDDSRVLRIHLGRMMQALGWQTLEATDGRQALDVLRVDREIDLALMDVNMPELNGMECLRQIRSEMPMHRVKVMMVTTESDSPLIHHLLQEGADEFLMKPFTVDHLRGKLELLSLLVAVADHPPIESFSGE